MKNIIFYVIIGFSFAYLLYSKKNSSINNISAQMLREKLKNSSNIFLIDVRNENEYNSAVGHIKESILFPLPELENNIEKIRSKKNDKVYVICLSGSRSAVAVKILNDNNIEAENVKGGMIAWNNLK